MTCTKKIPWVLAVIALSAAGVAAQAKADSFPGQCQPRRCVPRSPRELGYLAWMNEDIRDSSEVLTMGCKPPTSADLLASPIGPFLGRKLKLVGSAPGWRSDPECLPSVELKLEGDALTLNGSCNPVAFFDQRGLANTGPKQPHFNPEIARSLGGWARSPDLQEVACNMDDDKVRFRVIACMNPKMALVTEVMAEGTTWGEHFPGEDLDTRISMQRKRTWFEALDNRTLMIKSETFEFRQSYWPKRRKSEYVQDYKFSVETSCVYQAVR